MGNIIENNRIESAADNENNSKYKSLNKSYTLFEKKMDESNNLNSINEKLDTYSSLSIFENSRLSQISHQNLSIFIKPINNKDNLSEEKNEIQVQTQSQKKINHRSSVNDLLNKVSFSQQKIKFKEEQNKRNEEMIRSTINSNFKKSFTTDSYSPSIKLKDIDLEEIVSRRLSNFEEENAQNKTHNSIEFSSHTEKNTVVNDNNTQINYDSVDSNEDLISRKSFNTQSAKSEYTNIWSYNDNYKTNDNDNLSNMSIFTIDSKTNKTKIRSKVDILRQEYIYSLIKNKIWDPKNKRNDQFNTIVILDWDDTLFCSSYLFPQGCFEDEIKISDNDQQLLIKLEFEVLKLFNCALKVKSDVFIITNSSKGWVEYSTKKYLPSLEQYLNKFIIIYSRDEYENVFPGDSRRWKIESFLSIRERYFDVSSNIINIGDSFIDIEAGGVLAKKFKESYLKSIKFREVPTILEMIKQISLITNQFDLIFKTVKNLTIKVEKK